MPASCGEIRPSGATAVASVITSPAPPRAKEPRWTRCQSVGRPSTDEYWHIGETHSRLRIVVPRRVRGEKRTLTSVRNEHEPLDVPAGRESAAAGHHRTRRGSIRTVTTHETQRLRDLALLRRVRDRIDREYAQPLDVEALARGVHMSAGHLSREFRRAYDESPYSYLMTRRIERAMALLRRGDLSVTEVCFAVGCQSLGTFSTRFTELVGMPPSAYRRRASDATAGCRRASPSRSPGRSGIEKRCSADHA